jgi:hypothetical protein
MRFHPEEVPSPHYSTCLASLVHALCEGAVFFRASPSGAKDPAPAILSGGMPIPGACRRLVSLSSNLQRIEFRMPSDVTVSRRVAENFLRLSQLSHVARLRGDPAFHVPAGAPGGAPKYICLYVSSDVPGQNTTVMTQDAQLAQLWLAGLRAVVAYKDHIFRLRTILRAVGELN